MDFQDLYLKMQITGGNEEAVISRELNYTNFYFKNA